MKVSLKADPASVKPSVRRTQTRPALDSSLVILTEVSNLAKLFLDFWPIKNLKL